MDRADRSGPDNSVLGLSMQHNSNSNNATRHAEWQRDLTVHHGETMAAAVGYGKETYNAAQALLTWNGGLARDILVDLHNNVEGRKSALENRAVDPNNLSVDPLATDSDYYPNSNCP